MVVGSGLVARGFSAYINDENYLIFASGVSNSTTTDVQAFAREEQLLKRSIAKHQRKTFVYFSTCSIYDPSMQSTPYVYHKKAMENLLQTGHTNFRIFRISNLVGNTKNPNTFLNFFANHILSGEPFFLWKKASRNIIDMDDAFSICNYILRETMFHNELINIANPENYPVSRIVKMLEAILDRRGNFTLLDKGNDPKIDIARLQPIFFALNIRFEKNYLTDTLTKYFQRK